MNEEEEREREREMWSRFTVAIQARLDAAPEGLSVTNDHDAMHTQTDQGQGDVQDREKNIY